MLGEKTFQFSPAELQNIHCKLFDGVFDHAGKIRTYNITKKEWVLKGDTVMYASFDSIRDTLDYDFSQEKSLSYDGLSLDLISVTIFLRRILGIFVMLWYEQTIMTGKTEYMRRLSILKCFLKIS